ncbi:MAG: hypothetical protein K0S92_1209 [Desertimonas sp.]|jgi:hypothetical protein|nr:hypothetical protein [Desertimonas sp.]
MSGFPRSVRPGLPPDEAVRRYVEMVRRDIEPDPLFRQRLRGTVVNRFVAERESAPIALTPRSSQMGRLGRACLYASVATAISVGGVMAASESALPGSILYPLKLHIEEMRLAIAPAHLGDDLAAYAVAERIDELGRLVESGEYGRATDVAAGIAADYRQLASVFGMTVDDGSLAQHLARLDAALDHAPAAARRAIERAMSFAPGLQPDAQSDGGADAAGGASTGGGSDEHGRSGSGSEMDNGADVGAPDAERTPLAERTPEPEATTAPKPEPMNGPRPSARPESPPKRSPAAP